MLLLYHRLFVKDAGVLGYALVCILRQTILSVLLINYVVHPALVRFHALCPSLSSTTFFVVVRGVVHESVLLAWLAFAACIHRYGWFASCHIVSRRDRKTPSRDALVRAVARRTLFIHAVVHPLTCYLLHKYLGLANPAFAHEGWAPLQRPLLHQCYSFAQLIVVNEFATWAVHRFTHTPTYFKKIHCLHHTFLIPEVIGGEHAHEVEHFLGMQMVVFMFVVGTDPNRVSPDIATFLMWTALKVEESCQLHCSLDLNTTFLGKLGLLQGWRSRFHYAHHTGGQAPRNLSSLMLADYVFGTMDEFIAEEEQRLRAVKAM